MTEAFDAAWLDLREAADHRSRATDVLPPLRAWWVERPRFSVLDLGCGTGSNLRYLAPRLPGPQRWTLLDRDPRLLGRIGAPGGDVTVRPLAGDLAVEGLAEVAAADLVTASALLDLVSPAWLSALVDACVRAGCGALFALTYDGTIEWGGGGEPDDLLVQEAVNEHQRRDKGLGPALGPTAVAAAEQLFRRRGCRTLRSGSPWRLGREDAALAGRLVEGWARAVIEQRPDLSRAVRGWAARRSASIGRGDFSLVVGHVDLLALPTEPRST